MRIAFTLALLFALLFLFFGFVGAENVSVKPAVPAPAPTLNASQTGVTANSVTLHWTDNSNNETGFKIKRAGTVVGSVTSLTTYADSGLVPSTAYTYTVAAYNDGGDSAESNEITVTTLGSGVPPTACNGICESPDLSGGCSSDCAFVPEKKVVVNTFDAGNTQAKSEFVIGVDETFIVKATAYSDVSPESIQLVVQKVSSNEPPITMTMNPEGGNSRNMRFYNQTISMGSEATDIIKANGVYSLNVIYGYADGTVILGTTKVAVTKTPETVQVPEINIVAVILGILAVFGILKSNKN